MQSFRRLRGLAAGLALAGLVAGAVACGSSKDEGKTGGTISVLAPAYPDALDPGLAFSVDSWQALTQVYPGLLVFPHKSGPAGAKVAPGLAEALPEVSADGRTYKLKLRKDLRFSNGKPLKASDFKASIERLFALDSGALSFGFSDIVGAEQFAKTKRDGIPGITADDATGDITIRLAHPRGAFTYELALPFAGIVPKGTPPSNQTKSPPPGAGRYEFAGVEVNRSYKLVRNPNFSPSLEGTAVDVAKPDAISVKVVPSVANAATQVSQNRADFMIDNPPGDRIAEIRSRYADRYRQFPTPSVFWFFMNTETKPFNDVRVRRAVNYAIDPDALNRIQGGVVEPGHTILPPGVPGYEKSADQYPNDIAKAKQLVKEAGAEGAQVKVWGNPDDPTKATVEYYADVLNRIGLKAKTQIVPSETYIQVVGDRKTRAQTGWASYAEDYPHPADFIDLLLNPNNVTDTGNTNFSYNASDHELGSKIDALAAKQLTPETEKQWAALDREIQERAYWAPYGTRRQSTFFSDRMDFENCRGDDWPIATHDWARFCLK